MEKKYLSEFHSLKSNTIFCDGWHLSVCSAVSELEELHWCCHWWAASKIVRLYVFVSRTLKTACLHKHFHTFHAYVRAYLFKGTARQRLFISLLISYCYSIIQITKRKYFHNTELLLWIDLSTRSIIIYVFIETTSKYNSRTNTKR